GPNERQFNLINCFQQVFQIKQNIKLQFTFFKMNAKFVFFLLLVAALCLQTTTAAPAQCTKDHDCQMIHGIYWECYNGECLRTQRKKCQEPIVSCWQKMKIYTNF